MDGFYEFFESLFGLDKAVLFSGLGVTVLLVFYGIAKFSIGLFKVKISPNENESAVIKVKGNIKNSEFGNIKATGVDNAFSVGKDIKNTKVNDIEIKK